MTAEYISAAAEFVQKKLGDKLLRTCMSASGVHVGACRPRFDWLLDELGGRWRCL